VEASASAPHAPHIEAEPLEWQPRVTWVSARLLPGAASFFFASFLFAYFYLRLLDVHHAWRIGAVHPSIGLGVAITVVLVASAVLLRLALIRRENDVPLAAIAMALALLAIVLQVVEWTTLGFGPASGGYASVFVGWTSCYAVMIRPGLSWIETQVAGAWRERRQGTAQAHAQLTAGLEACSFFWAFYVGLGVLAFVVLYIV